MFQQFVDLGISLFLFLCLILAYITGIKHGRELSRGNAPKLSINPARPIFKAVEKHKEDKKAEALGEELTDIMSMTKESMLKAVKRERDSG